MTILLTYPPTLAGQNSNGKKIWTGLIYTPAEHYDVVFGLEIVPYNSLNNLLAVLLPDSYFLIAVSYRLCGSIDWKIGGIILLYLEVTIKLWVQI